LVQQLDAAQGTVYVYPASCALGAKGLSRNNFPFFR
jgi:hypothetical protein